MRKLLLLPITLPLGMARGALEGALKTTAEALMDVVGRRGDQAPATTAAPAPKPPAAAVEDLEDALAAEARLAAEDALAAEAGPVAEAAEADVVALPVTPVTPAEVAEDLGLEEGHVDEPADELVETEGAAAPGAEITVDEPWPGYAGLKAADVVDRLKAADAATKAVVRLYEQQHRRRRTVLAATGR